MHTNKKHKQSIQILIIPDDKDEPKTFSIPVKRLKYYKILAAVLVLHILVGIFAYFEYFKTYAKNKELLTINIQLEKSNKKIYQLATQVKGLESSQTKIRSALGLGNSNVQYQTPATENSSRSVMPSMVPALDPRQDNRNRPEETIRDRIGFLKRSKSVVHDLERSMPTYLPVEGVLTQDYEGASLSPKGKHHGIDIAGKKGLLVKAAADGVVVFAGWTIDLGNLVIIYHGNGFFTYYGHNQEVLLSRNAAVKKGEPVALLGNSGHSTAPHLHFEIWRDGMPLDPKDYLLAFSDLKASGS